MSGASAVPPTEVADRYTIERELGRGATSIVYLARDRSLDRRVALKVLRPELAESLSAERFLREIRLTQQLVHPAIAPVLDSGVANGSFYCVLDYMDGGTLRDRLERDRQLPVADVAAIAEAIGSALEYAHGHRIIHRDVKPENILFGAGHAWLADFGIARALETAGGPTTSTGVVRGTPAYMSPEQASGEREYDGRSDVYSLACVLYEALAGMPAFDGPNVQAVLAQRLVHAPRELHVYRPAVTAELEAVMARALATAPADRYQTAGEFTTALCTAIHNLDAPGAMTVERAAALARSRARRRRRWMWGWGFGAVGLAVLGLGPLRSSMPWASRVVADTTRIAVFPIPGAPAGENLLARGFERWRGVTLTDSRAIDEALRGRTALDNIGDAAAIAARLGAGRFVLTQVDATSGTGSLSATLYDLNRAPIHYARLPTPPGANPSDVFAALADSLLLRGEVDDGPEANAPGSRDLPSLELILAARHAIDAWDLTLADTELARAARRDTSSGRPSLWLAQVREWSQRPVAEWSGLASLAVAREQSLSSKEQTLAAAMVALADSNYSGACARYQDLVNGDARTFEGWYGLGECHALDHTVVRDARSLSGWSFQSSYQRALEAYVRAFSLRPSTYRGFAANGYSRLRNLLFVSMRILRPGVTARHPVQEFYGSPILDGDSILFVPVPVVAARAGAPVVSAAQIGAAVGHLRRLFQAITSNWARAAPASAAAKQAVSISLEYMSDPAAIDSFARAQQLETDPLQRLRLAATRAYVHLKLGAPGDSVELGLARTIADSLLRAGHGTSRDEAGVLAPMAALTGRCADAATYLRRAAQAITLPPLDIPQYIVADANATLGYAALDCPIPPAIPTLATLTSRLKAPGVSDSILQMAQYNLAASIVRSSFPLDSSWVDRLSGTSDYLLVAEHDLLHRRPIDARRVLGEVTSKRAGSMPGDITPDAAYPEAELWIALGDSAAALEALDSSLDAARNYPPMDWSTPSENVLTIASFIRAMALRAQLEHHDRSVSRRWSSAVAILWADSGPELRSFVGRLHAAASR